MNITAEDGSPCAQAERDPETLTFAELRAYRQRLNAEEDRVSYWRRLAYARIDVLEAGANNEGNLSFRDLVQALGDTGTGTTRRYLGTVRAADALPHLPDLGRMWATEVDARDPEQVADALERIQSAVGQLTLYREALHTRIDEASAELIRRYRENPLLALSILPD